LVENILEFKFKNISRTLKIIKKGNVPDISCNSSRSYIHNEQTFYLRYKKKEVYMYFSRLLNLLHKNLKKLQYRYK